MKQKRYITLRKTTVTIERQRARTYPLTPARLLRLWPVLRRIQQFEHFDHAESAHFYPGV